MIQEQEIPENQVLSLVRSEIRGHKQYLVHQVLDLLAHILKGSSQCSCAELISNYLNKQTHSLQQQCPVEQQQLQKQQNNSFQQQQLVEQQQLQKEQTNPLEQQFQVQSQQLYKQQDSQINAKQYTSPSSLKTTVKRSLPNKKLQPEQIKEDLPIVDYNSINIDRFIIKANQVEIKKGGGYFQLLGRKPIKQKPINTFLIDRTLQGMIKLAIVDKRYLHDRDSFNKRQCFYYSVKSGIAWESGIRKVQGLAVKEKQKVTMIVSDGKIQWKVKNQTRNMIQSNLLSVTTIQWVPFIALFDKGDRVIWE